MRCFMLGIAVAVTTLIPNTGRADDQQIADFIKGRLQVEQQQGNLRGFNVDMRVDRGTVWFKGHVSNTQQEMMILKTAQGAGHLGVVQVVDDIEVKNGAAQMAPAAQQTSYQPTPAMRPQFQNAAYQQTAESQHPYQQTSSQEYIQASAPMGSPRGAMSGMAPGGTPMPFAKAGAPCTGPQCETYGGGGMMGGPMMGPPPMAGGGAMPAESPNLPGYSWPGYAAHPNYGAVSYPRQHSASAWPYIGPFYPYPQVPLGWRKVSLEWDDGWWQLDFHDK